MDGLSQGAVMSETQIRTLAEALPQEQARVRELLGVYSVGIFGAAMLESELRLADQAAMSGDVVAMLRAYERLRGCQ